MAVFSQFRLGDRTLSDLDALAASAGSRAQALREAVAYWRRLVEEAGRRNADELSEEDWARLAHLNRPDMPQDTHDEEVRSVSTDWSVRLAIELCGMWEGRALILPSHKLEAQACGELARRIGSWGPVRGYALFACLRHFWSRPGTPEGWWAPEAWMGMSREGR